MGNPFMPLTEGLHQRCDDSYFRVQHMSEEGDVVAGWYWNGTNADGEWDGEWITGPFETCSDAARSGWEGARLARGETL